MGVGLCEFESHLPHGKGTEFSAPFFVFGKGSGLWSIGLKTETDANLGLDVSECS